MIVYQKKFYKWYDVLIPLTLFLPAKGGISPYMSFTWPSPVSIGLRLTSTNAAEQQQQLW